MKKSEKYTIAITAVLESARSNEVKIEVLEMLLDARATALFTESREESKE